MLGARRSRTLVAAVALIASMSGCTGSSAPGSAANTDGAVTQETGAGATSLPLAPAGFLDVKTWSQVKGTDGRAYIADAQGRALQLRGFNIKTVDPLKDASDELLALGQQRGFNLLRLSVYWDQFEPTQGSYNEQYFDAVATVLDRAKAHGILVIINFHQDVFGPKFGDHGIPEWATRTDGLPFEQQPVWFANYLQPAVMAAWEHLYEDADLRQAQIDAWVMVATRFSSHPAVLGYDLLNEPFGKKRDNETLEEFATRAQAVQLSGMYQRLTDAMHAVDPDHWVFIEPPNVASLGIPVALSNINGTKIAYSPHFYSPTIETATYMPGGEVNGFDPAFFDKFEAAIRDYPMKHGYPTFFGEWGIANPERPGMDDFVARSLALMDRVGSGWTQFQWCKSGSYCPLDENGNDRPAIGQIVQPWAHAIAGSPTSFSWNQKARVLKVVFVDSAATGTTDLVVPPAIYPEGYEVATSDAEGTWSFDVDGPTNTVRITTNPTGGPHTICLTPKGTTNECR